MAPFSGKLLVSLVLIFLCVRPSLAADDPCTRLLTRGQIIDLHYEEQQARETFVKTEGDRPFEDRPALVFQRITDQTHPDGPLFVYQLRDSSRTYSSFGTTHLNPNGSHRFTELVIGSRLAKLFGISFNPLTREVTLPGPQRIQSVISRLNRHLPADQQILWTYYEESGKTDALSYLTRWTESLGLPISVDLRIHDVNYHLSSILIPNSFALEVQRRATVLLNFATHLLPAWDQAQQDGRLGTIHDERIRADIEKLSAAVIKDTTHRLDRFTGNFTSGMMNNQWGTWLIDSALFTSEQRHRNSVSNKMALLKFTVSVRGPSAQWVREQVDPFLAQANLAPEPTQRLIRSPAHLMEQIRERRIALEHAAIALEQESHPAR